MKVGDLVRFSKAHIERPGLDYTADWVGLLVKIVTPWPGDSAAPEYHILWTWGKLVRYPASWIGGRTYIPFEVHDETR